MRYLGISRLDSWDKVKDNITIYVYNKNELKRLKQPGMLIKEFLEMYLVLVLEMRNEDNVLLGAFAVDSNDLKKWKVTASEVEAAAYSNILKDTPVISYYPDNAHDKGFYMISVYSDMYGKAREERSPSTVLLRKDILKSLADKTGGNLILLERNIDKLTMCAVPEKNAKYLYTVTSKEFYLEGNSCPYSYYYDRKTENIFLHNQYYQSLKVFFEQENLNTWVEMSERTVD